MGTLGLMLAKSTCRLEPVAYIGPYMQDFILAITLSKLHDFGHGDDEVV
jgi:hypothetical protein